MFCVHVARIATNYWKKKLKWENLTIFRKFLPKFIQEKSVKNDYCVLPLRLLPLMTKKFQNFFGTCFRYMLYELKQIFGKKTKMTKFDEFREIFIKNKTKKISKKQKNLVVKNRVFWQKQTLLKHTCVNLWETDKMKIKL